MKKLLILLMALSMIACSSPTAVKNNGGNSDNNTNTDTKPPVEVPDGEGNGNNNGNGNGDGNTTPEQPEQPEEKPEEKPEEPTNPYQGIAGKIPVDYMFVVGKRFVYLEGGYVWSEFIINPNGTVTHSDKSVITKEMGNIQYDERGYLKSFTVIFNRALGDGSYAHRRLIVKFNNNNYTVAEVHDSNWWNHHNISIIEGQCCGNDHNVLHVNFNVEI